MQEKQRTRVYRSVLGIKQANKTNGYHWFDASSMRFFRSRVGDTVYHERYFISSEQREHYTDRMYTIRVANDDGSIDTIGQFMAHTSYNAAKNALDAYIKRLATQESEN